MPTSEDLETIRNLLCELGKAIRSAIQPVSGSDISRLSAVSKTTEADTIYEIDQTSEDTILDWLSHHWPAAYPMELVMEGIEEDNPPRFPKSVTVEEIQYTLILDPIDGTRGIMYNKRSAWSLAGIAPKPCRSSKLEDIVVSVMTELPTSKQAVFEQLSAVAGCGKSGVRCEYFDLAKQSSQRVDHSPSRALDLRHGFASVAKFFPAAKALLAAFEEDLYLSLLGRSDSAEALVFDDQYISTGGQLYEIISGHDRLVIDIRPLAYAKVGLDSALSCHPYDLCTALVARELGAIVESPDGEPFSCPLDTTTPISWVAYANTALADQIRPHLNRLIAKHFTL